MNYKNKNELEINDTTTLIEKKFYTNECNDIYEKIKKLPHNFIDLSGQKFGRLIVVSRGQNDKYGKTKWICKCNCGNEKIVSIRELKTGHSKSCGCLRQETTTKRNLKRPYHWIYIMLKGQAKYAEKNCTITYDDILDFVKIDKCHYCNTEIIWSKHGTNKNYHSYRLDRKDNNMGYTKDNCVVCCKICNKVKLDIFTHDEMLKIGPVIKNIMDGRIHD